MLNWVSARTQPCFTPLTIRKDPARLLFNLPWPRWSLCSWITTLKNFGGSQGAPWSSTAPFCSLCQTLWPGPQTLHTVLCSASWIYLGAVWRRTPCLCCPWWLWTDTGFLVDGLQRRWVPICLGAHEQSFFSWDGEWSDPLIVGAIWLFSLVFVPGDDDCIAEITCKFALLPTTDKEFVNINIHIHTQIYIYIYIYIRIYIYIVYI